MKYLPLLIILSLIINGCSKESAEDVMKSAKQKIEQQKYDEALPLLEKLVTDFPESDLAPTALSQIATLYQNKFIKNISTKESLLKAASVFKEVYDKYPKSREAGNSLFLAGFIKANEPINEYKEATELYTLFLRKFPKHEMAGPAQDELNNMGIPPEKIIERNGISTK